MPMRLYGPWLLLAKYMGSLNNLDIPMSKKYGTNIIFSKQQSIIVCIQQSINFSIQHGIIFSIQQGIILVYNSPLF